MFRRLLSLLGLCIHSPFCSAERRTDLAQREITSARDDTSQLQRPGPMINAFALPEEMATDGLRHQELNQLCLKMGLTLLQHGAESALVESVSRRTGLALGAESVDVAIMANALTITTRIGGEIKTAVLRNNDQGVNMHVVIEAQRLMLDLETGKVGLSEACTRLANINRLHYPSWVVIIMIGLSCAAFGRLAKSDWTGCLVTFVASGSAMAVRLKLAHWRFSPMVTFCVTAFVATSISAQGLIYAWGQTPKIAMAASCLLLVPGVPLINGVSDMVKGYVNTGISRWAVAALLSLATCAGIVLAMTLWQVWAWL